LKCRREEGGSREKKKGSARQGTLARVWLRLRGRGRRRLPGFRASVPGPSGDARCRCRNETVQVETSRWWTAGDVATGDVRKSRRRMYVVKDVGGRWVEIEKKEWRRLVAVNDGGTGQAPERDRNKQKSAIGTA
jgi:hypothetical protein